MTATAQGGGFPGGGVGQNARNEASSAERGVRSSPPALDCRYRGRCTAPAVGVCTLCGDPVCARHASSEFHFHVRLYAAKGAVA